MSDLMMSNMVDECGITRELSAEERNYLAGQIGQVNTVIDLAAGDLINQECKALGLKPLTAREIKTGEHEFTALAPLLTTMGYTLSTAAAHASVARAFERNQRCAGLGLAHYRAVQGMRIIDDHGNKVLDPRALALLQEAQIGYQKKDGTWVTPHPASWLKKKRAAIDGNTIAAAEIDLDRGTNDFINEVMPAVSKTLNSLKLDAKKKHTIEDKIERALNKEAKKLEKGFSSAVDSQVNLMLADEKAKLRKIQSDASQDAEWTRQIRDGVRTTITEGEFKSLRQFCHPDKHHGHKNVGKIYEIVNKIGEKLGFA
jgi:hypothetical protein